MKEKGKAGRPPAKRTSETLELDIRAFRRLAMSLEKHNSDSAIAQRVSRLCRELVGDLEALQVLGEVA